MWDITQYIEVAIPFEVGQVSTEIQRSYESVRDHHVAIPFEVGQVSTDKAELEKLKERQQVCRNPF